MRKFIKILVIVLVTAVVVAQFLPDTIRIPGRWPPRLPRVEFVRPGSQQPKPSVAVVTATRDTFPIPPPAVTPPPPPETAQVAAVVRDTVVRIAPPVAPTRKKAPARHTAPKQPAEDTSEEAAWFEQKPTMTIVPTRSVTEVRLSSDTVAAAPEARAVEPPQAPPAAPPPVQPAPPASEGPWPILCGQVVDPSGDPIANATIHIEGTDQEERSDSKGLFCLPCPAGRRELTISAEDRDSVRYPLRMESGQANIRITMPPAH